jgi:FkbM family methyltransferase
LGSAELRRSNICGKFLFDSHDLQNWENMNLLSKMRTLAANPAMLSAYARWIGAKLLSGKPARIPLRGGVSIGGWLSFSEYWSFRDIIPERERAFVESCLANNGRRKATAFDIGANVGAFTCLMASLGQSVHAFEPIPETFCRLKANVTLNGLLSDTHLNCLALGKNTGLVTFRTEEFGAATNRMAVPSASPAKNNTSVQLVAVTSLDEYCQQQDIKRIDFVKLDVEGMEPFVLQGAKRLLRERRIAAILIEICPVNLCAVGLSPADLYHEFESCRYGAYALGIDGKPGTKLRLCDIEAISLSNVALLPES